MTQARRILAAFVLVSTLSGVCLAADPPVDATVDRIVERFLASMPADTLVALRPGDYAARLTAAEREFFATGYWTLAVDRPVTVTIFRSLRQPVAPYWLAERGFELTGDRAVVYGRQFEAWSRDFDAGSIGLGVHGFADHGRHYFAVISSRDGEPVTITDVAPAVTELQSFELGTRAYLDEEAALLDSIPQALVGDTFLVGARRRAKATELYGLFRKTPYPSSTDPDLVALTWSEDPRTTQTIQWRTSPEVRDGVVRYRIAGTRAEWTVRIARTTTLRDQYVLNDPVNMRYTVVLRGLMPGTRYEYVVGSPAAGTWTEPVDFTTAPDGDVPFTFVYMGDPQSGLDVWGAALRKLAAEHAEVRFYVIAGDLVNRGNQRDDWDSFFHNAQEVFSRRPLVPAIGNHEYQGVHGPWMYLRIMTLPENGPELVGPEHSYALRYSSALVVSLDSNQPPEDQVDWLDDRLGGTDATWKFATFHHPLYSSYPRRDNVVLRRLWGAVFDRHHLDLALQGHDHAYLRTFPMYAEQRVDSPAEGTISVVSMSGLKMYSQGENQPYRQVGFTRVPTFQVIDVTTDPARLEYRAYDHSGEIRDEFTIEK